MAGDTVEVRIIADASGAQAGMRQAAQATDQLKISASQMAEALRQAGGDLSKINPAMLGVGEATQAASAMNATKAAATESAGAMEGLRLGTSGVAQEAVRLGRAFAYGRFDMIPGELATLTSRMGALGTIMSSITPEFAVVGGAVAVLTGGLVALTMSTNNAAASMTAVKEAFAGVGMQASTEQIAKLHQQLGLLPDVTKEAQAQLEFLFLHTKGATPETMTAWADLIPTVMKESGKDALGAGKELTEEFSKAIESANPAPAVAAYFEKYRAEQQREVAAVREDFQASLYAAGGGIAVTSGLFDKAQATDAKDTINSIAAALKSLSGIKPPALDMSALDQYANGLRTKVGESATQAAQETVSFWTQALATAETHGGQVAAVMDKLHAAQDALAEAQKNDADKAAQADKNWADNERSYWQSVEQEASRSAAEITKSREEMGRAVQEQARKDVEANKQMEDAAKRAAEVQEQAWKSAMQPITTAFDGMLAGVLRGTETWRQAAAKAGENIVVSYVESAAKIAVNWLAMEALRTVATVTGAATRTAADSMTGVQLLENIGKMVAGWLGFETTKTTTQTASDAAGLAASKAAGEAQVMTDAGVAAAGTMAAISAIPFVGPFMAPGMAATALAETMAFGQAEQGGLTGAGGLVLTHPNEMILPADITAGLTGIIARGAGSDGSSSGGAASPNFNFNIQTMDGKSFQQFINNPATLNMLAAAVTRKLAANPSLQGAY